MSTTAAYPGGTIPASLDGRTRYREILCHLVEAGPEAASNCDNLMWRLQDEFPTATPARILPSLHTGLRIFVVSGAFSDCREPATVPFEEEIARLTAQGTQIAPMMVSGRSGTAHNARQIADVLRSAGLEPAERVVLVGYSKGTIDILEFLATYPELAQSVVAVVSIAGAVKGSPLADDVDWWYRTFLDEAFAGTCDPGDGQVLHSLRPATRQAWFESHTLPGHVSYYSLAAFTTEEHLSRGLKPTWRALARHDRRNDGQVTARDAVIPGSTLLGFVNADHWDVAISVERQLPRLSSRDSTRQLARSELLHAALLYVSESLPPPKAVATAEGDGG
jgi:pimeloyl-ACP methyl ester carboxylesterase